MGSRGGGSRWHPISLVPCLIQRPGSTWRTQNHCQYGRPAAQCPNIGMHTPKCYQWPKGILTRQAERLSSAAVIATCRNTLDFPLSRTRWLPPRLPLSALFPGLRMLCVDAALATLFFYSLVCSPSGSNPPFLRPQLVPVDERVGPPGAVHSSFCGVFTGSGTFLKHAIKT